MSQEVRTDRLQVPLSSAGQSANRLEVLLGAPAPGHERESSVNRLHSNHCESGSRIRLSCLMRRMETRVVVVRS